MPAHGDTVEGGGTATPAFFLCFRGGLGGDETKVLRCVFSQCPLCTKMTRRRGSKSFVMVPTLYGKLRGACWRRRVGGNTTVPDSLRKSAGNPRAEWQGGVRCVPLPSGRSGISCPSAGRLTPAAPRGSAGGPRPLDVAGAVRIGLPPRGKATPPLLPSAPGLGAAAGHRSARRGPAHEGPRESLAPPMGPVGARGGPSGVPMAARLLRPPEGLPRLKIPGQETSR